MAEAGMAGVEVISAGAGLAATLVMVVSAAEVETLAVEEHPGMAKAANTETEDEEYEPESRADGETVYRRCDTNLW